ncbi:hypothetical protein KC19_6G010100 [Ceratodon purpureus]|uniref:Uncharacterized protein n=1 Tax=Ceratodon purpureus TaxID=3225 RepID=A0A8T0HA34_CERPU|nr:hypothetical protein KC19_6G010100 [Ceratodon purpureus]
MEVAPKYLDPHQTPWITILAFRNNFQSNHFCSSLVSVVATSINCKGHNLGMYQAHKNQQTPNCPSFAFADLVMGTMSRSKIYSKSYYMLCDVHTGIFIS